VGIVLALACMGGGGAFAYAQLAGDKSDVFVGNNPIYNDPKQSGNNPLHRE